MQNVYIHSLEPRLKKEKMITEMDFESNKYWEGREAGKYKNLDQTTLKFVLAMIWPVKSKTAEAHELSDEKYIFFRKI